MSVDLFKDLTSTEKRQGVLSGIIAAAVENKQIDMQLSDRQFAEHFGISESDLVQITHCSKNITFAKVIEILDTLGIKYEFTIDLTKNQ